MTVNASATDNTYMVIVLSAPISTPVSTRKQTTKINLCCLMLSKQSDADVHLPGPEESAISP